jgi:hypothetical protein
MTEIQDSTLIKPGTYAATLQKVQIRPSKSKPGQNNLNLTLAVVLDDGRVMFAWDTLPEPTPAIAWRYLQYMKALNLNLPSDFNVTPDSFKDKLVEVLNNDIVFGVDIGVEQQKGYAPRNKVSKVMPLNDVDFQSVLKAQRHDTDTDAPAQPSRFSSTGEQSHPSESAQTV